MKQRVPLAPFRGEKVRATLPNSRFSFSSPFFQGHPLSLRSRKGALDNETNTRYTEDEENRRGRIDRVGWRDRIVRIFARNRRFKVSGPPIAKSVTETVNKSNWRIVDAKQSLEENKEWWRRKGGGAIERQKEGGGGLTISGVSEVAADRCNSSAATRRMVGGGKGQRVSLPSTLRRRPSLRCIPPSRTVARVLTERRAFGFSAPAIPLQPLRLRFSTTSTAAAANFQNRGCFDATRRDADRRCALSLSLSLRSFLPRAFLSLFLPLALPPSQPQFSPEDRAVYR